MRVLDVRLILLFWACCAANFGCEGTISGSPSSGSSRRDSAGSGTSPETPVITEPLTCPSGDHKPASSPLRRLTRAEYDNTVSDLLGDTTHPATAFTAEEVGLGFTNNADVQAVSDLLVEQYETAASALATAATTDLTKLLGCGAPDATDECVHDFLGNFALRAYRRPATEAEIGRLLAFYQTALAAGDPARALGLTLQAMLQSPYFLYRVEIPDSVGVRKATGYELASRLSYLFWGSMPDQGLFDAAASGLLDTAEGIAGEARRLAQDARHRQTLVTFFDQWLDLEKLQKVTKDAAVFPLFTAEIKTDLREETELFTSDVVLSGSSLKALLTAPYTFMNQRLRTYYGVAGAGSAGFEKVDLDPTQRAGLLTQAGLLAAYANIDQTSPVARGFFIRERLLCAPPDPPPPNVNAIPPELDPSLTTRDRFEQHRTSPSCASCHELMDPVGFGFEHFDGVGLWRDQEAGNPIDASGEIQATEDADGTFDGALELADKLAGSAQVRKCVVKQWFRFGYGRGESEEDQCLLQGLDTAFEQAGGTFSELLIALTQSDAFRYRTDEAGDGQ